MSMGSAPAPKKVKPPPPPESFATQKVKRAGAFLRFQLRPQGLLGATKGLAGQAIQRGKMATPEIRPAVVRGV